MGKKEFFEKEYMKLTDFYADYISMAKSLGYSMKQVADYLYDSGEISYWQRDLLKKGVSENETN